MKLYEVLNTCNAAPDIRITIYQANDSFYPELVYQGKCEELNEPNYYNGEVTYFHAEKLNQYTYITDMTFFIKKGA